MEDRWLPYTNTHTLIHTDNTHKLPPFITHSSKNYINSSLSYNTHHFRLFSHSIAKSNTSPLQGLPSHPCRLFPCPFIHRHAPLHTQSSLFVLYAELLICTDLTRINQLSINITSSINIASSINVASHIILHHLLYSNIYYIESSIIFASFIIFAIFIIFV